MDWIDGFGFVEGGGGGRSEGGGERGADRRVGR